MRRFLLSMTLLAILALGAVWYLSAPRDGGQVEVAVPALSAAGQRGEIAWGRYCAECHGAAAGGTAGKGPPLVHVFYKPGHHADAAFRIAVRQGARSHHWRFGDMKPVEGISEAELADTITFVREVQRANGIF